MGIQKLKDALLDRAPKGPERVGCSLCGLILEDLHENGRLTNHPVNVNLTDPLFPPKSKILHLRTEGLDHLLKDVSGAA